MGQFEITDTIPLFYKFVNIFLEKNFFLYLVTFFTLSCIFVFNTRTKIFLQYFCTIFLDFSANLFFAKEKTAAKTAVFVK